MTLEWNRDVLTQIFPYFSCSDLCRWPVVSKKWKAINLEVEWAKLLLKDFAHVTYPGVTSQATYKKFYQDRVLYDCSYAVTHTLDHKIQQSVRFMRNTHKLNYINKDCLQVAGGILEFPLNESKTTFFISHLTFASCDNPSKRTDSYFIKAPSPKNLHARLFHITSLSGIILVFVPFKSVDAVWEIFKAAHMEGKLGYGLQVSTAKPNPLSKTTDISLMTVHLENCTDVLEVGRVAWEINRLLGDWKGVLNVVSDISTELKCTSMYKQEEQGTSFDSDSDEEVNRDLAKYLTLGYKLPSKQPIFSISSHVLKQKTLSHFLSLFQHHSASKSTLAKNELLSYLSYQKGLEA